MPPDQLDNLVRIGRLKLEAPSKAELEGLLRSGTVRLKDSKLEALSLESRLDLAYNAAHALALAMVRFRGYRSENRYLVFQYLQHTFGLSTEQWRVLDLAHNRRNRAEYEGDADIDLALVEAVIRIVEDIEARLARLGCTAK